MTLDGYQLPPRMDAVDYVLQAMVGFYEGDLGWMDSAACKDLVRSPEANPFFSDGGSDDNNKSEPGRYHRIRKAKSICSGCPVRWECLRWSLLTEDRYAVAGGVTPTDRRPALTEWLQAQEDGLATDDYLDFITTDLLEQHPLDPKDFKSPG